MALIALPKAKRTFSFARNLFCILRFDKTYTCEQIDDSDITNFHLHPNTLYLIYHS